MEEECATQVHISSSSHRFKLPEVKRIAKAALFWERSIDMIMPKDRLDRPSCQSNHASVFFNYTTPDQDVSAAISIIEAAKSIEEVVARMCTPFAAGLEDQHFRRAHLASEVSNEHCAFRANSSGLLEGGLGTVECAWCGQCGDGDCVGGFLDWVLPGCCF
jgi:hypothetical protein